MVDVYKDKKKIRTITKFDYFGERSILNDESRTATVKANGDVTTWILDKTAFNEILDQNVRE